MQAESAPPGYLTNASTYKVSIVDEEDFSIREKKSFQVVNDGTWPTSAELGLNTSQYEAYKLSLTHEFAVIQGPPGTGKTFLGVKIAETLLTNLPYSMLVICYTNHALDQFLENILSFTKSIARIGSQSRNQALENYNLNKLRSSIQTGQSYNLYRDQKNDFKISVRSLKTLQKQIELLYDGILTYETARRYINEVEFLQRYYDKDVIAMWLFENLPNITAEPVNEEDEFANGGDKEINNRHYVNLDDEDEDDADVNIDLKTSFSLDAAQMNFNYLSAQYNKQIQNADLLYKQQLESEMQSLRSKTALFKVSKYINVKIY